MTPERIREIALSECPPVDEIIWLEQIERACKRAVNKVLEEVANHANDFDFGLDSQRGLVADIRARKLP